MVCLTLNTFVPELLLNVDTPLNFPKIVKEPKKFSLELASDNQKTKKVAKDLSKFPKRSAQNESKRTITLPQINELCPSWSFINYLAL